MTTVTSRDGTTIAFERTGQGPALVLVGGTFEYRAFGSETAHLAAFPLLSRHFTVFHYDRRGRGESADTPPYAVEREIEDLAAVIDAAGGTALVSGISSGAALALEAAIALGDKITGLALYEPPYNSDPGARRAWVAYRQRLDQLLAEGRRDDAVASFMMLVGLPAEQVPEMRQHPIWPQLTAVAPTLAYDARVPGDEAAVPIERAARVAMPTLVLVGGASYPFMRVAAEALAEAIPRGQLRILEGQTHEVAAEALAPALVEFFGAGVAST